MILVAGIPTEPPVEGVIDALAGLGADVVVLNQRMVDDIELDTAIDERGRIDGVLRIGRRRWLLREVAAVYARLMDDRRLPELAGEPEGSPRRVASRRLHDDLVTWLDVAPALVINRTTAMATNSSKPYQAQRIVAYGFETPETVITNDPAVARTFIGEHDRVVFKSISGVRSIVQTLGPADVDRLDRIRFCPVQFQAFVPGVDVRVHVVGDVVHASEIISEATDYRYAVRQTETPAQMRAIELPADVASRCVALAAGLGLEFAGIDLSFADDGRVFCFEVNPSPAYSYFEAHTDQPIAASVARHLVEAELDRDGGRVTPTAMT